MNALSSRSHAIFVLTIARTSMRGDSEDLTSPHSSEISVESQMKSPVSKPWKKNKTSSVQKMSPTKKKTKDKSQSSTNALDGSIKNKLKMSVYKAGQRPLTGASSKLSLIDLAGSERAKTSGAEGGRLTESNNM
jgi:hypothetical protein